MMILIDDEAIEISENDFISILTHANVKARELASDFENMSHNPDEKISSLFHEWLIEEKNTVKLTDKLKSIFYR